MRLRQLSFAALAAAVAVSACSGPASTRSSAARDEQQLLVGDNIAIAQTEFGKVQGYILHGVYTYLGIPYGAPTSGANRFMPPKAPEKWDGVKQTLFYGEDAPQNMAHKWQNDKSAFTDHWNYFDVGEDCLNLNVWTPGTDNAKRPVLVWMHGGGFSSGNSIEQDGYHGENMAKEGNVVFVSVSHRLNAFGFSDFSATGIPELQQSGNVGMLDLIAALQWVHNNIAAFGGDPGNVTIMGQSGGGSKVCNTLAMPASAGLVHKAVALSGNSTTAQDAKASAALGLEIWKAAGSSLKKLQEMPWEEYYELAHKVSAATKTGGSFAPHADGVDIPTGTFYSDPTAASAKVPMILCTTSSEMSVSNSMPELEDIDFAAATKMLGENYGQSKPEELMAALREAFPTKKPIELINILVSNRRNVIATADAKSVQAAPVYLSWFDYNAPLFDGRIRAFHCADICYWFKNTDRMVTHTGGGKEPRDVSDKMSAALLSFMRTGDPNCAEIPAWPVYNAEDCPTMIFSKTTEMRNAPDKKILEVSDPYNMWARRAPAKK
ncbi:MAG: carboxylesterase family protein [Bacteroidales bacterium]|nr:carboxylesterase family protein [Bacteroidales bacterium]